MGTPGSERQDYYRSKHPQMNATFRDMDEYWIIQRALRRTGRTPREVLLNWAQQALAETQPSERAGKPDADNSSGHEPVAGII
jgi:hypothetical protein